MGGDPLDLKESFSDLEGHDHRGGGEGHHAGAEIAAKEEREIGLFGGASELEVIVGNDRRWAARK